MENIELNSARWLSTKLLEGEIWKEIEYPHYAISNYGRLKRLAHTIIPKSENKYYKPKYLPERICKLAITKCGYVSFRASVDGKLQTVSIHRAVAKAFIPNPDNLPFINHINEDKTDNRVENLHWCTAKFNSNYGTCQKRRAKTLRNLLANRPVSINQYTKDGELVHQYTTTGEITEAGFNLKTVKRCCRHRQKAANGYHWFYSDEPFKKIEYRDSKGGTIRPKVLCYSLDGDLIKTYDCLNDAAMDMGGKYKKSSIANCIHGVNNTALGYKWKYVK